jgi:hypothetical protein
MIKGNFSQSFFEQQQSLCAMVRIGVQAAL